MSGVKRPRERAAEATRRAIVAAATRLFVERGYTATTIAAIAAEAGVAVQTIYNAVGSKRDVLALALDVAVAGDGATTPVAETMARRAEAEPDPSRILDHLVELWRAAAPRTKALNRVLRAAAAVDEAAAELERSRAARRLANYRHAARVLDERGALRPGLGHAEAAAIVFALGHGESRRVLMGELGWTLDAWCAWVRDALAAALLRPR